MLDGWVQPVISGRSVWTAMRPSSARFRGVNRARVWPTVIEVGLDLTAWPEVSVDGRAGGGHRNEVWAGTWRGVGSRSGDRAAAPSRSHGSSTLCGCSTNGDSWCRCQSGPCRAIWRGAMSSCSDGLMAARPRRRATGDW